jgi:nuclear pore complex protein Nup205
LKGSLERLVNVISRDAIDGNEVWKTVSFMLLDSLARLSCAEKQHIVLSALVRQGVLHNVVRDLKESDLRLQAVLKPDPGSCMCRASERCSDIIGSTDELTPLYVYEAKMSMLIRIAQTRAGAERLLDIQLLPTLARCDFLDARPEADQSFMGELVIIMPTEQV